MSRKTIDVATILAEVNYILATSTCSADIRQGEMNVIEFILHKTDNYAGFRYLPLKDVPAGQLPGIRFDETASDEDRFKSTDKTRVQYYVHKDLCT